MKAKILLLSFIFSIGIISCKGKSVNNLFEILVQEESNEKYIKVTCFETEGSEQV